MLFSMLRLGVTFSLGQLLLNRWAATHWWAVKLLQMGHEMFQDNAIVTPSRNNYA